MYALAFSCVCFAATLVIAEPIPIVHNRFVRRDCDNHTNSAHPSYGWASTNITIAPLASGTAASISGNLTAGAFGTSTSSNISISESYPTTPTPTSVSWPGSGWTNSSVSHPTFSITGLANETLAPTCTGSLCVTVNATVSSNPLPAATSSSGINETLTISSTLDSTITVVPSTPSGSVGFPGVTSISPANETSDGSADTTLFFYSNETVTFTQTVTLPPGCTGPGYGCSPPFPNATLPSWPDTTAAGPIETGGISTTVTSTTVTMVPRPEESTNITSSVTASETLYSSSQNGSWPTSSSYSNLSSTVLPVITTASGPAPTAASNTSSNTDVSPNNQSTTSTGSPSNGNLTISPMWPDWNFPGKISPTTTLATSYSATVNSSSGSGAATTSGNANSTASLAQVEAEVGQLAEASVGLIEKIESWLAAFGGGGGRKKRRSGDGRRRV